jgi:hypothetical protein
MGWAQAIIHWQDADRVFISVPFTWYLPKAKTLATWFMQAGHYVYIGGPAVELMPDYLSGVATQVGGDLHPLPLKRHNPDATFTSRGCPNQCGFCAVPRIEGDLRELADWRPAPIVCDNNILATSQRHFDNAIDRLKQFRQVDFNQGLDARLLNAHHIDKLKELSLPILRFSFDHIGMGTIVTSAIQSVLQAGFAKRRVRCYVMFGFHDSPDDALYRVETIKKLGVRPFPQRYQALDGDAALAKDSWIGPGWVQEEMARFQRYWCRQNWFSRIPYAEFTG